MVEARSELALRLIPRSSIGRTRSLRNKVVKGIQRRSVDCVTLASDQPLSRYFEAVEENHTPVPEPELVNWPAIFLRPFLRCGCMVFSKHVEVPMQEGAAWNLRNVSNGRKVDIEETKIY